MVYLVFSVYDRQSRQYSAPFTSFTSETAKRDFVRACNDSVGKVDKFPADFELYRIGEFNSDYGSVAGLDNVELVAKGSDYVEEVKL